MKGSTLSDTKKWKKVGYKCVFIAYVFMLYVHIFKNKFSTIFLKT